MKQVHAERWRTARARGIAVWVLQRGVLAWGLSVGGAFVAMQAFRRPDRIVEILLLNVPLWLAAGALFGVCTWDVMEWQYRRYLRKHGTPEASQ